MKRLVLLGGGHAHVHVLQEFGREPPASAEVVLVSPYPRQIYSGMVPGWVAGRYTLDDCVIALRPLARAARVQWIEASAVSLNAAAREIRLDDGRTLTYDVTSLDTGSLIDGERLAGAARHALFVRPMESFTARWAAWMEEVESATTAEAGGRKAGVVVVGGGAGGVELALAMQRRLGGRGRVVLVTGGADPVAGHPAGTRRRIEAALRAARVAILRLQCIEVAEREVVLQSQAGARVTVTCDLAVIATGSDAPRWLADSGLSLDAAGFVATGPTLQTLSHPEVFAAGDVSSRPDAPHPRSGVYAVRAGPPLALNLRRFAAGGTLVRYRPQSRSLNLLACGDGTAIASWGSWSARGHWVWRWKDRIDRGFVAKYRRTEPDLAATAAPATDPD